MKTAQFLQKFTFLHLFLYQSLNVVFVTFLGCFSDLKKSHCMFEVLWLFPWIFQVMRMKLIYMKNQTVLKKGCGRLLKKHVKLVIARHRVNC